MELGDAFLALNARADHFAVQIGASVLCGAITGVTSAAVVWMLAAIGSTIGVGQPSQAIGLSVSVVAILIGVRALERASRRLSGGSDES